MVESCCCCCFNSCLVVTPNLNTTTRKGKEQYCCLQQAQYSLSSTQIFVPKAHRLACTPDFGIPISYSYPRQFFCRHVRQRLFHDIAPKCSRIKHQKDHILISPFGSLYEVT